MRSAILAFTALMLCGSAGCHHYNTCGCQGGHGLAGHGNSGPAHVGRLSEDYIQDAGPTGPPSASYAYPYYTTRAPRDFLQDNPMGIGP